MGCFSACLSSRCHETWSREILCFLDVLGPTLYSIGLRQEGFAQYLHTYTLIFGNFFLPALLFKDLLKQFLVMKNVCERNWQCFSQLFYEKPPECWT